MEDKDKKIICKDCNQEFIFSVDEQKFYKEKGFENEPTRCKDCRQRHKAERNNFRRNNNNNSRY